MRLSIEGRTRNPRGLRDRSVGKAAAQKGSSLFCCESGQRLTCKGLFGVAAARFAGKGGSASGKE